MRQNIAALAAGSLFGLGLVISHMVDPLKVQAFLDVAGDWDPSVAFVMVGAIPATAIGLIVGRRTGHPLLAADFAQPSERRVDARLIGGAVMFGAGWGLVGYCPGPALAALGNGASNTFVFVAAMGAGMAAFRFFPFARHTRVA